ncbi:MAG: hypothetical protein EAY66_03015 [Sphingobacteriales bacterium]|nr:MAG: hypothetical protein EAY66_03015 [Sphingobacteriales bacterium]
MQTPPQTIMVQLLHPNSLRLLEDLAQIDVIKLLSPVNTDADLIIPEWHKDIVRKRVAKSTDENFTEMNDAFSKLILE